jgi:hypothetical protein
LVRWGYSRPYIAEYLCSSGASDAFSIASQFTANVGEDEAYLVSTLVRGLVGRTIFSADQALVVARSGDSDPTNRKAIENDRANALRAINNGGTLVARFTLPLYARSGATLAQAYGVSASAGVIGPITGDDSLRTGVASVAGEALLAIPIRDLGGSSTVLADLVVGLRGGYTYAGRAVLAGRMHRDVSFGQFVIGLRQSGALSVSALVTVANNKVNELVPRLAINFSAQR